MMVSRLMLENVRETKITDYLKTIEIEKTDDEKEMELSKWLSNLIEKNRISKEQLNACLYKELMYGHRRLIRCYELKAVRKIKRVEDWNGFIDYFNCPSLNFNRILQTTVGPDEGIKVCSMDTIIENGVIKRTSILFVYNMTVFSRKDGSRGTFYSYIPVTFDLESKELILKIWNKDDAMEGDSPKEQLDFVIEKLGEKLEFETKGITNDPQKVLYEMSKTLFDEFFKNLPNNDEVEGKRSNLVNITSDLLSGITLENIESDGTNIVMNSEVINVQEELYKLLQQVALYDYLKDHTLKTLLENTDRYISRIRFSDRDNLTASLTSETGVKCIFDTKTFMCVRNSLDLVEKIVSIVVSFAKNSGRGLLSVKYDASDMKYLSIHILYNKYYTEDDFKMIWELYKEYESDNNAEIGAVYNENNVEAM